MDPSRAPDTRIGDEAIAALRITPFRWLWTSSFLSGLGMFASVLVLTWLALEVADSVLAVGLVLAARVLPQLILGLPAGALADRHSRARLVMATNVGSGLTLGLLCLGWHDGSISLPVIASATFLIGCFDAVRVTAGSALAFDLVGRHAAGTAMALSNLAAQLSGIAAGLLAGYGLSVVGATPTLLVAGVAYVVAAGLASKASSPRSQPTAAGPDRSSLWSAARLLARNRQVGLIAVVVAGTEMFAFSNMTLLPSFARDVFGIGAVGLGWLLSARAVGGTLGLIAIASRASRWRTLGSFALLAMIFGIVLIAFAITPFLGIALVLAGAIGAVGAAVDSVGQTQVQHAVPEAERGSAMGVWMFCLGLGLFGHIETGIVGSIMGAQFAQIANGLILVVLAAVVGVALPVGLGDARRADPAPD